MTAETAGIIGLVIGQVGLFAKLLIDGKLKARESHVLSIEKGFERTSARQDKEIDLLRAELNKLRERLEALHELHRECTVELSAANERLELLEEFRRIAKADSPTGATLKAMPPEPEPNGGCK